MDRVDPKSYGTCAGLMRRNLTGGGYRVQSNESGSRSLTANWSSAAPNDLFSARGCSQ